VDLSGPTDGWAAAGFLMYRLQSGSWTNWASPPPQCIEAVASLSSTEAWAVGSGANAYHFTGGAWVPVVLPTPCFLRQVRFAGPNRGWAIGFISNGNTPVILGCVSGVWSIELFTTNTCLALAVVSANEAWALAGQFFHFHNGAWANLGPCSAGVSDAAMINAHEGWAVGVNGEIWHFY